MSTIKIGILELPLIPLRGLSVFPYMVLHFDVGREKSIKALEEAMMRDQMIFLTTQKDVDIDLPEREDFYETGTICKVKQMLKLPGDAIRVLVEGVARGKVLSYLHEEPYFSVQVERYIEMRNEKSREVEALMRGWSPPLRPMSTSPTAFPPMCWSPSPPSASRAVSPTPWPPIWP